MKYEEQERKIYAKFDDKTIRVYQAYNNVIADEAIKLGTFGEHFSLTRMTWIKPSFLWMMYRCGWTEKENQERDIYGKLIGRRSIQLGIRGEAVKKYVNEWIVKITDITDEVKRIKQSIDNGTFKESFLPEEKEYVVK